MGLPYIVILLIYLAGKGKKCDTYGSPYDCESVMHYASNQMGKGGKTTISE